MEGNSPKPTETGFPVVYILEIIEKWLELEGGISKPANVVRALVNASLKEIRAGRELPLLDRESLRAWVRDIDADTSQSPASKWLPKKELLTWWDARTASRHAYLQANAPGHCLELRIQDGGGRGNASQYGLIVSARQENEHEDHAQMQEVTADGIEYSCEPAKSAFWLRWLLPPAAIRLQSWRGPIIVLFALGSMAIIPLLILLALALLNHPGEVRAKDLQLLLLIALLVYAVYRFVRPWWHLPKNRITIASDFMLSSSQLYGQLQLNKDRQKRAVGTLALVRYYGSCCLCGGTVELTDGGREFPARIIGRCRDSPAEHIYSFEPVSRRGISLR